GGGRGGPQHGQADREPGQPPDPGGGGAGRGGQDPPVVALGAGGGGMRVPVLTPEEWLQSGAGRRRFTLPAEHAGTVDDIIRQVRAEGDAALLRLTEQLDGVRLDTIELGAEGWEAGVQAVAPE